MHKIIIILIIILFIIFPAIANDNQSIKDPIIYRVLIDQNYGFFRIYEMHDKISGKDIYSKNGSLNISKGDIVVFVSNTIPDSWLTIISEEKLWNDTTLKNGGKEFSYKFNNSGIYNVHIKERPKLMQKIIVGPIFLNVTNNTGSNVTKLNISSSERTQNMTNRSNLTIKSSPTETMTIIENSSLDKPVPKSTKSKYDTIILSATLIAIFILSGRIKE